MKQKQIIGRLESTDGDVYEGPFVPASDYDKLVARVAELEKDAARLDWLDSHPFTAYRDKDVETRKFSNHVVVVHENWVRHGDRRGNVASHIRAAIDRARGLPDADSARGKHE